MANAMENPTGYNFGQLKDLLRQIIDRGGDSVSSDSLAGYYLNAAENYVVLFVGNPSWLNHTDTFTTTANSEDVTLPVNVKDVSIVYDQTNQFALSYMESYLWSNYIVKPSNSTGTSLAWTKMGYERRDNTGSPSQAYGALKIKLWPVPTSAVTLNYECVLRPGTMVADSDHPVLPTEFHPGLLEVALWHSGSFDIGTRAYREHAQLAQQWLGEIRRSERRQVAGNLHFVPREEQRRRSRTAATPLTRRAQLYGGHG